MQTFDKRAVVNLLTEVVRKRGEDFVYDRIGFQCVYTRDGKPSCGIGQMLSDIGVTIPVLKNMDMGGDSGIEIPTVQAMLNSTGFKFTPGAIKFMMIFQRWQDQEKSYSECLAAAKAGREDPFRQ